MSDFTSLPLIQRMWVIAREIGAVDVSLEPGGPGELWTASISFQYDRVLTGRGLTPDAAYDCLVKRRPLFEQGYRDDSVDILALTIAKRGLRRCIERKVLERPASHGKLWCEITYPPEDIDLMQFAHKAAFGRPMRKSDISPDAYGLPWFVYDAFEDARAVRSLIRRLRLMGYAYVELWIPSPASYAL